LLKLFHFSSKSRFGAKNKKIGESPVARNFGKVYLLKESAASIEFG
jgi:hypothetical protein